MRTNFALPSVLSVFVGLALVAGCSDDPSSSPACGDGQLGDGEQCDDGNTADGDGCSATCTRETGIVAAPDAGKPDSSTPDASTPDASTPDGGADCSPACPAGEFCDADKTCRVCNATRGCATGTVCDTAANGGAGACKVCVSDNDCPGSQTCRTDGSACEGCTDNASCTAETPICKTTSTPSACVECTATDSKRCDASKPTCANDFCGCTADTDCMAVANSAKDFCDRAANAGRGQCVVCSTDSQCQSVDPNRPVCDGTAGCICRSNADCTLDQLCGGGSQACEAAPIATTRSQTSAQLQATIAAPAGPVDVEVTGAFVTYLKPSVAGPSASEPVGFFVQAEAAGPALFVTDPTASARIHVGDRISFTATTKAIIGELRVVTAVTNLTVISSGHPVGNLATAKPAGLKVDRSADASAVLVSGLSDVESTLVRLQGKIVGGAELGTSFTSYAITTPGITSATNNLRLRLPTAIANELDPTQGCDFSMNAGVMYRTNGVAQPSTFSAADVTVTNCPAPKLVSAKAASPMQVVLTFDRTIAELSITNVMTQFTFDNGLLANAAVVAGNTVTLTTGPQAGGTLYKVTVASSVTDKTGNPVSAANNSQTFKGFAPRAVLRITEVGPTMASNKDLVELVAITGGTVNGFVLQQDINSPTVLGTFPDAVVATGDIIVVHMGATTDSETTSKNQFPASATAENYDTAWDFKGGTTGITFSSRLILALDPDGAIQDGVAFHRYPGTPPGAYPNNLQALQAVGHWLPADCGGALCTTNSTPTAMEVSADWTAMPATNATTTSNTIRRVSVTDTNTKDDWAVGPQSWGLPNP
ncbi:hypothetical protein [Labilithrix luteola]|nr:hypothetical protein [Labilithrix luteola]